MTERREDLQHVGRLAEMGLLSAALMHELRQPLLAIQAVAEMAVAAGSADEDRWRRVLEQLRHVRSLVEHQGGLVRGEGPVSKVDLRDPVRRAIETVRPRAKQARVGLAWEPPASPMWVWARETALWQVVVNLVHNAVDASEGIGDARVWVRAGEVRGRWRIEVVDEGGGLPEPAERLFDPFVTHKPPGRGTGLGLFIARNLTEEAGGRLSLERRRDAEGTLGILEIPAAG